MFSSLREIAVNTAAMVEEMKIRNQLLTDQNALLKRIADSLAPDKTVTGIGVSHTNPEVRS